MVERICRAMCAADMPSRDPDAPCFGSGGKPAWTAYSRKARAAIEAMREPTEAMVDAGAYELLEVDHEEATRAYRAMISAALNPGDRT